MIHHKLRLSHRMFLLSFLLSVFGLRVTNLNVQYTLALLNDFVGNPIENADSYRLFFVPSDAFQPEYSTQKIYSFVSFFSSLVCFPSFFVTLSQSPGKREQHSRGVLMIWIYSKQKIIRKQRNRRTFLLIEVEILRNRATQETQIK